LHLPVPTTATDTETDTDYDRIVCKVTVENVTGGHGTADPREKQKAERRRIRDGGIADGGVTVGTADPRQVFCSPINNGVMSFTLGNKFELVPDAAVPDSRSVHISLFKETTKQNTTETLQEIHTLKINIGELALAEGLLYVATFTLPGRCHMPICHCM
jgi:hypothetical protein